MQTDTSLRRPWHPTTLMALMALWLATAGNWPLWMTLHGLMPSQGAHGMLTLFVWIGALSGATLAFLAIWVWPRWLKVAGLFLLLVSAAANYFMFTYGVVIDPTMVSNALHTDAREVRDLLDPDMLVFLGAGVVLPGWWWWRQPLRRVHMGGLLARQLGMLLLGVALAGVLLWVSFQDLASTMRNHKPVRYMINPFNTVYALSRHTVGRAAMAQQPLQTVGEDATLHAAPVREADAPLVVVMVGETVRAANVGLAGYGRDTTPRLRALQAQGELVYFSDVRSCGTNTQVSVPCMFSDLPRQTFDTDLYRENALDVMQRAGLAVLWLDNQSGCKGVCDRVPHRDTRALSVPALCDGGECFDEVMLKVLPDALAELPAERRARGTVVVMHQMGSHGPAYFKRSPAGFKPFGPECVGSDLQACTHEALVNTYDNSVRYTDHVVAETIAWLKAQPRPTALIYVSDHGESLGEKGLYLHGMPYRMAPDEQTRVPLLMWMNPAMQARSGLDPACLAQRAREPASHDHLFHTLLGLAGVSTRAYQTGLDLTGGCRSAALNVATR